MERAGKQAEWNIVPVHLSVGTASYRSWLFPSQTFELKVTSKFNRPLRVLVGLYMRSFRALEESEAEEKAKH